MSSISRHIRFFISSTFLDLQAERNHLVKKVFPELRKLAAERNVTFSEVDLRWGITEEEASSKRVLDICLQEIDNSIPFFIGIIGHRYGWCPTKEDLSARSVECYEDLPRYIERGLSATEIEIQYGVLEREETINAYFYIKNEDDDSLSDQPEKLAALKKAINDQGRYPVSYYSSLEAFGNQVRKDFNALLDKLFPVGDVTPYERQKISQDYIINKLCRTYIPVPSYDNRLNDWVNRKPGSLMLVYGESGIGKSAFLAHWISQKLSAVENIGLFFYFTNNYLLSENASGIVAYISESLVKHYGFDDSMFKGKRISDSYQYLDAILNRIELDNLLKPIIIIDGINQLEKGEAYKLLGFLCASASKAEVIVSTIDLDVISDFSLNASFEYLEILSLNESDKKDLVSSYLAQHGRSLDEWQMSRIVKSPICSNTLILKTLLDELLTFGVFKELNNRINYYISPLTGSFYNCFLSRLEEDYGFRVTQDVLCLIFLSRKGLTEHELKEILELRNIEFSQFILAAGHQLINKDGFLSFSHQLIIGEIKSRYLSENATVLQYRERIISYFSLAHDTRAVEEVSWQLYTSGQHKRLHAFIADYENASALIKTDSFSFAQYWKALSKEGYLLNEYIASDESSAADDVFLEALAKVAIDYFYDYEMADMFYSRIHENLMTRQAEFNKVLGEVCRKMSAVTDISYVSDVYNPNDLCNQGDILLARRNYREALKLYEQALNLVRDSIYTYEKNDQYKFQELDILIRIADAKDYMGDKEGAIEDYNHTYSLLNVLKKQYPSDTRLVDFELDLLVNYSTAIEDTDTRLDFLNRALDLLQQWFGMNNHRAVVILQNLGQIYNDKSGLSLKAVKYYKKALQIQVSLTGEHHRTVAELYFNLGSASSDFSDAFHYYDKAAAIYTHLDQPLDLAKTYNSCGEVFEREAFYLSAFTYYAKALLLLDDHMHDGRSLKQEVTYNVSNVGSLLNLLGYIDPQTMQPKVQPTELDVLLKAAEYGVPAAQYKLGYIYFYGEGLEMDKSKGVELLKKAFDQGDMRSAKLLMLAYYEGAGVEQNHPIAFSYILAAAKEGDCDAQYYVGLMLQEGEGVEANIDEAIRWYTEAAEQYYAEAYNDLAWSLYLKNCFSEALKWALKAIEDKPENPDVYDTAAHIYKSLGQYELSLKCFEQSRKLQLRQD